MNRIFAKFVKQYNISPNIGAFTNAYAATGILYAPLTMMGVATTLYGLWGKGIIEQWFPWFTFPIMVGCMVLFILMAMILFYKIIIPSQVAFNMQQNYKHRNPLVADMKVVLKLLKEIQKEQGTISKRLDDLEGKLEGK